MEEGWDLEEEEVVVEKEKQGYSLVEVVETQVTAVAAGLDLQAAILV